MRWSRLLFATTAFLAWAAGQAGEEPDYTGAELYQKFCASCHGVKARGNGPVARTLKPKVPDLTLIAKRNGGTFPAEQVRQSIDGQQLQHIHGTPDMPVWGWEFYAFSGEDEARRKHVAELIGRLVEHLSSMQRK